MSWTIKKVEHQRIDAFELWCWRRLLRVPWTARRSNHSILKEINPEYSLEGLMLKLKLQYFGHLIWRANSLEKTLMLEWLRAGGEGGDRRHETVGWHHWLNGIEFEQAPGVGDGQGGLVCCSPRGCKESDTTERRNSSNSQLKHRIEFPHCERSYPAETNSSNEPEYPVPAHKNSLGNLTPAILGLTGTIKSIDRKSVV